MRQFGRAPSPTPTPRSRRQAIDLCKQGIEIAGELDADLPQVLARPGRPRLPVPGRLRAAVGPRSSTASARWSSRRPSCSSRSSTSSRSPGTTWLFSTAARTLLGIEDIGAPNLGIVLDMGHSLFAKETPADVLQLIHRRGRLVSVEVNDNLREWDDDMVVGSVHPVETLEFLWALRQIGWQKPVLLDQFPFREDPVGAATLSIQAIEGMERMLDRIDVAALDDAQERQDALAAQAIVLGAALPGARPSAR